MTDRNDDDRSVFDALPPPYAKLKSRSSTRREPSFGPDIGTKMRAMYDDLLRQPIPDRFVQLLEQIDQARETRSNDY